MKLCSLEYFQRDLLMIKRPKVTHAWNRWIWRGTPLIKGIARIVNRKFKRWLMAWSRCLSWTSRLSQGFLYSEGCGSQKRTMKSRRLNILINYSSVDFNCRKILLLNIFVVKKLGKNPFAEPEDNAGANEHIVQSEPNLDSQFRASNQNKQLFEGPTSQMKVKFEAPQSQKELKFDQTPTSKKTPFGGPVTLSNSSKFKFIS